MTWADRFSPYAKRFQASSLRELFKLLGKPGLISLASGAPEPSLFPTPQLAEIYAELLREPANLQYGTSEGYGPLREQVAARMTARGVRCDVENILITNGGQQGIDFAGQLLLGPGSGLAIQNPSYLGAILSFRPREPRFVPLDQLSGAAMAYVMADFHNPTGLSLSLEERLALTDAARTAGAALVEDDPYGELWFDTPPPSSLATVDLDGRRMDEGNVIHIGTFSKTLAPGLRVGWVAAPRPVISQMVLFKQAADMHPSTLNQVAVSRALEGLPADHYAGLRALYRQRRDQLLTALDRHIDPGVRITRPNGGLFLWATLPEHLDASAIFPDVVAAGVAYAPTEPFHPLGGGPNTFRMGFTLGDADRFEEATKRLASVLNPLL
jgi:2-aminoadipate transaminase